MFDVPKFIKIVNHDSLPKFECIICARKFMPEFESYHYELFIIENLAGEYICSVYKTGEWIEPDILEFEEYTIISDF